MRVRQVLVLAGLLTACGGSTDPFVADMRMICAAADGHHGEPPEMRTMAAMRHILDNVKTPEAGRLVSAMMQAAPGDRAAMLAPALERARLSRCPTFEPL